MHQVPKDMFSDDDEDEDDEESKDKRITRMFFPFFMHGINLSRKNVW